MILLVLAIVASTFVGAAAERRWGAPALAASRRVIDVMVWGLLPFVVFFVTARLHFHGGVGVGLVLGYLELAIVGGAAYLLATRVLHLARPATGSLLCCVILANTGYLGIALNAALLGHGALGPAIAWDAVVSQVMLYGPAFAIGAAFGTRAGTSPRERVRAFFTRNPVLYALAAGLVAPNAAAPDAILHVAEFMAAYALLPLGFFILGVNLMAEEEAGRLSLPVLSPVVLAALGLRMALAPLLLMGLAALTISVPDAYLVQAAMPSGINSLIVAHLYGLDLRLSAGIIAWSTALAIAAALILSVVV